MTEPRQLTAAVLAFALLWPALGLPAEEPRQESSAAAVEPPPPPEPKPQVVVPGGGEIDDLIAKLNAPESAQRYAAKDKLQAYLEADNGGQVLETMRSALTSGDKLQRYFLVACLASWAQPEGLKIVAQYLNDPDEFVQIAAISGLGRAKSLDPYLLDELRKLIVSPNRLVRHASVLALGHQKDTKAADDLVKMLSDDDPGMRITALRVLREVSDRDFGSEPEAWQPWLQGVKRNAAAKEARINREGPAATGPGPSAAVRPLGAGSAPASLESGASRFRHWLFLGLALLLLALPVGWLACRWWLRATMDRLLRVDPAAARDPAVVALRFGASDYMPDWIVYPFLAKSVETGSALEVNVALNVLMFRLHGGCAATAVSGGRLASPSPIPGARERIARFPRGMIADMATAGYQAGRCLIRIAEPDNPVWRREPSPKERSVAERHLSALLKR